MEQISDIKIFGGRQGQYRHQSNTLNCDMEFSVYLPPQAKDNSVPVLYWLSGLTCTDQNFVTKAGAQQFATEHGIAIVCPDTSPRGDDVPDDPEGAWDFGKGAGFYVNATQEPWTQHYQMFDYITQELPTLLQGHFPINTQKSSISGHSMGGHGALTIALNNTEQYKSVSAFSPIVSPLNCLWGEKALGNYLGGDKATWAAHDTCELVRSANQQLPTLIDQGTDDGFLEEQLKTSLLIQACEETNYPMTVRYQEGYDHSYFFIASFIGEHIAFHAKYLNA